VSLGHLIRSLNYKSFLGIFVYSTHRIIKNKFFYVNKWAFVNKTLKKIRYVKIFKREMHIKFIFLERRDAP